MYSGVRSKPNLLSFGWGKPGGEGEGQIEAAAKEPPEYEGLVGCAALGGVSGRGSPRLLL
jgi:hypothetical protein